jgi:hypothetical protein
MRGRPDRRFELIPGQRAETLDALTYALAAREGVALDAREEALKLYPASAQITPCAPVMASCPSPVMVLTPVFGAAAMASCLFCFSFSTTFDPIKPVPPITTIFVTSPLMMV